MNGASLALAVMLLLTLPISIAARPSQVAPKQASLGVVAGLRWLSGQRVLRTLALVTARTIAAGRTLSFSAAAGGALLGGVLTATIGIDAPFVFSALVAVLATTAWWLVSRPTPS